MLDPGFWITDTGSWMLGTGSWILDARYWITDCISAAIALMVSAGQSELTECAEKKFKAESTIM